MFVQHMVAVLRTGGMMATVMPHGVLFRGGEEKDIREGIHRGRILEAVIGLPPNLFYGTGIPACILVMQARIDPARAARTRCCSSTPTPNICEGRAQNYLRPEDIEKITQVYRQRRELPGYARLVTLDEIGRQRLQPEHPPLCR